MDESVPSYHGSMPLPSTSRSIAAIEGPFRILVVCTGNICRSPLTEALLRERLEATLGTGTTSVSSAGTAGVVGAPMDVLAAREAERIGVVIGDHRARRLTGSTVSAANLVIGLSREHRAAAVGLEPRANRWAFTVLELAAILPRLEALKADAPPTRLVDRLSALVEDSAMRRGSILASGEIPLDIEDPYRRAVEVHRRVAEDIEAAVDTVVRHLHRLVGR